MQINKNEVADYVSFLHISDQNLFFYQLSISAIVKAKKFLS